MRVGSWSLTASFGRLIVLTIAIVVTGTWLVKTQILFLVTVVKESSLATIYQDTKKNHKLVAQLVQLIQLKTYSIIIAIFAISTIQKEVRYYARGTMNAKQLFCRHIYKITKKEYLGTHSTDIIMTSFDNRISFVHYKYFGVYKTCLKCGKEVIEKIKDVEYERS